jgi:membrane fusion protein, multidrug efflux system
MRTFWNSLMAIAILLALIACHKPPAAPPIRPVLSIVVSPEATAKSGFAGTIEARYQSSFGFRVLGRIIARDVNVGDRVNKGTQLAALDPVPFELAVRTAEADVANNEAQLQNATATEERQRNLFGQGATAKAQFEAAQHGLEEAKAGAARARANLDKAQEQLGYTKLHTDSDGVVTAVSAEVGQVVQPGQAVVTVARPDVREAVVDVPDGIAVVLQKGASFQVTLEADSSTRATGQVREMSPSADAATRTRRVRITLDNPPEKFRLGTVVKAIAMAPVGAHVELPATALFERDGKTMVWVVDDAKKTVSTRGVKIAARGAGAIDVSEGLAPGTRVVTAGVHSLTNGQLVKVPEEPAR